MIKRTVMVLLAVFLSFALVTPALANNTKIVALTFDDGPSSTFTPVLLDALAAREVRVTFFLVGYNLSAYKEIAQRAFDEGHQLCNHTYNHAWFSKLTVAEMQGQIASNDALIQEITGTPNAFLRVPYGDLTANAKAYSGVPLIQWSVDPTSGYASKPEEEMYENIITNTKDGSIILLHDTNEKNLNVAVRAIDTLKAQGYQFVTLNELFRLRGVQPVAGSVYYSVPVSEAETAFDEANLANHWAYSSIQYVLNNGIMGNSSTGFGPNQYLSRADAAFMLYKMAQLNGKDLLLASHTDADDITAFADIPSDAWYSQAVAWSCENSLLVGATETSFNPGGCLTKEEFYSLVARLYASELPVLDRSFTPAAYPDDSYIDLWAQTSVSLLRELGFVSLNDREIFRPLDNITRAEAAELAGFVMGIVPVYVKTPSPDNNPSSPERAETVTPKNGLTVYDYLLILCVCGLTLFIFLSVKITKVKRAGSDMDNSESRGGKSQSEDSRPRTDADKVSHRHSN